MGVCGHYDIKGVELLKEMSIGQTFHSSASSILLFNSKPISNLFFLENLTLQSICDTKQ